MIPVLVTGGAGYVGSHTCKALASAGYLPITYDNLSRGHAWAVKWGPFERGDIADGARLADAIARHRPRAVLHFAGYGYVGESMQSPELYYANNISNTATMLETLRRCEVKHLIFSSSCSTYGGVHMRPITEDVEQKPESTYGFSKLAVERMLNDYARAYGFASIALRYFNAAGADPDGELGEWHDPELHFIPTVLRVAWGYEQKVRINGGDYPTPDGSCVRDFIHVSDLADAHVLGLKKLLEQRVNGAFNLGNGKGYSLKEIVEVARRITGKPIPCEIGPRRAGDPPYAVGDSAQAMRTLGWRPKHADIDRIVEHSWRWMQLYHERELGPSKPLAAEDAA